MQIAAVAFAPLPQSGQRYLKRGYFIPRSSQGLAALLQFLLVRGQRPFQFSFSPCTFATAALCRGQLFLQGIRFLGQLFFLKRQQLGPFLKPASIVEQTAAIFFTVGQAQLLGMQGTSEFLQSPFGLSQQIFLLLSLSVQLR